jgi:hypothetical protein
VAADADERGEVLGDDQGLGKRTGGAGIEQLAAELGRGLLGTQRMDLQPRLKVERARARV